MNIRDIFSQTANSTNALLESPRREERVIAVIHSHWFVLLREVFSVLLLFILPFIAVPLIGYVITEAGIPAAQIGAVFGLMGSLWALLCWQLLFVRWTDYYFDVWIISNWRIIDIELRGLFKLDIATILDLSHIQDITTRTTGIIQNILGFGNITIQTAAQKREFVFEEAHNPRKVEQLIRSAQAEHLRLEKGESL